MMSNEFAFLLFGEVLSMQEPLIGALASSTESIIAVRWEFITNLDLRYIYTPTIDYFHLQVIIFVDYIRLSLVTMPKNRVV
jgi:hypothetical protein